MPVDLKVLGFGTQVILDDPFQCLDLRIWYYVECLETKLVQTPPSHKSNPPSSVSGVCIEICYN